MLNITKLFLAPCETYDDPRMRSYEMQASGRVLNELIEVTEGGRTFSSTALAGVAGKLLRPSSEPGQIATIANGWTERRYRFMMEIVAKDPFGNQENVDVYSGYTDYLGVNEHSGSVDPGMRLFFTNLTQLRRIRVSTPGGLAFQVQHLGTQQILAGKVNSIITPNGMSNDGTLYTAQPQDVFSALSRRSFGNAVNYDTRQGFGMGVKLNRRRNGVASRYMDSVLTAHATAIQDVDMSGSHEDYNSMVDQAKGMVRESALSSVVTTVDLLQDESFVREGSIPYGRLTYLCPHLDKVTTVASLGGRSRLGVFGGRGSTDGWGGRNTETIMAAILAQAVPSYMFDLGITVIGMTFTNQTLDGSWKVGITEYPEPKTFTDGMDTRPLIMSLIQFLQAAVLPDLIVNRGQGAYITMIVDVMGDTALTVSVDGGPDMPFTIPSFADGSFAPVMTNNMHGVDTMATHFEELSSALAQSGSVTNTPSTMLNPYGTPHTHVHPSHSAPNIVIDYGHNAHHQPQQHQFKPVIEPSYPVGNQIIIE